MLSPTDMRGLSDEYGSWKTICMFLRMALRFWLQACLRSRPSKNSVAFVGFDQAEDEAGSGRFAAARLADDPEGGARLDIERDVIDGGNVAHLAEAKLDREVLLQPAHAQERCPRSGPGVGTRSAGCAVICVLLWCSRALDVDGVAEGVAHDVEGDGSDEDEQARGGPRPTAGRRSRRAGC